MNFINIDFTGAYDEKTYLDNSSDSNEGQGENMSVAKILNEFFV